MARKRQSVFEDLFDITAKLPWWGGIVLALVSYLALHFLAGTQVQRPTSATQFGAVLTSQLTKSLASIGQYLLPFVFLLGAAASAITRYKRRSLYGSVASGKHAGVL